MRGRLHHVALDCPDPVRLAGFWSEVLGHPVTYADDDWVVVAADDHTSGLACQRVPGHLPPTWPEGPVPQQVHLDVMVEDPDAARPWLLGLGAVALGGSVYADPAGHPFCLVRRPDWAEPVD